MEEEVLVSTDVVDYTELLTSIDEKLNLLQNISTSLIWIYTSLFFIIGLMLMILFFVGKGDKG